MTTTGGRGDVDLDAPEVETANGADGDDIVVIPSDPDQHSRGRMRAFLVAAIVLVLAAAGITIALVSRDDTDASNLRSVARVETTQPPTTRKPAVVKPPAKTPASKPVKVVPATPTSAVAITPVGPPPVTPTAPPPTTPPEYPPSMLTWQATPAAFTMKSGAHATLTVTVTNPTDGTVTLGLPLSCPPTLQAESGGAPFGGGVCAQMAQVMSPHQWLTQPYTIYATSTGDASGTALAAGRYLVRVENLHSFWLTVTAS